MMEQHTQFMLFRRQQQIRNRGIIRFIIVLQSVKYETESNCELVFNSFRMARMLLPGIVDVCGSWSFRRRAVQAGAHHPVLLTTTAKY